MNFQMGGGQVSRGNLVFFGGLGLHGGGLVSYELTFVIPCSKHIS